MILKKVIGMNTNNIEWESMTKFEKQYYYLLRKEKVSNIYHVIRASSTGAMMMPNDTIKFR